MRGDTECCALDTGLFSLSSLESSWLVERTIPSASNHNGKPAAVPILGDNSALCQNATALVNPDQNPESVTSFFPKAGLRGSYWEVFLQVKITLKLSNS